MLQQSHRLLILLLYLIVNLTSEPDASSTAPSLSLPMTLYVSVVSAVTAAFAVTVYVIALPSATLVALAEREYPAASLVSKYLFQKLFHLNHPEIVEPVGNSHVPHTVSCKSCVCFEFDPATPDVSFPPTSKVNSRCQHHLTVTTAPLGKR